MEWRMVCEALVNISALRLFLLAPDRSKKCHNLSARLAFSSRLELLCEWQNEDDESEQLRVALPLCAFDHAAPIQALCSHDDGHIEVKLKLLDARLCFSPPSDVLRRMRVQVDSFFCKACGAKITHGDFKEVVELPSVDWRDVADHWFGICCCGSSIRTESMVARFENNASPSRGKLLLAPTTCIVHFDDICSHAIVDVVGRSPEDEPVPVPTASPSVSASPSLVGGCGSGVVVVGSKSSGLYDFLRGPIQPLSSSGAWKALRCSSCNSLLGTSTVGTTAAAAAAAAAVHLLKRRVAAGGAFSYHTLERDFLDELKSLSSYRYVVRDLVRRRPTIQLVLLNPDSLIYSGALADDHDEQRTLKPAVSLMFSDLRECDTQGLRKVEDWASEHKAEDIFLLEEEIELLLQRMAENHEYYPPSYSVTQGLKLSFITAFLT